jgi:hypothetical protein
MRKIIQLDTDQHDNVTAVCDDGTIWLLLGNVTRENDPLRWERARWPEIPQKKKSNASVDNALWIFNTLYF